MNGLMPGRISRASPILIACRSRENSVLHEHTNRKWKNLRMPICWLQVFVIVDGGVQNNKRRDVERESSAELRRLGQFMSDPKRRRDVNRDDFAFQTFTLPLEAARLKIRGILNRQPERGYLDTVEGWRQLADGTIEFTMRRWPALD